MNLGRTFVCCLCAALCGALSANDSTTVIPYAQLAPAVQKSIVAQLGNGKLGEITRDEENGDVTFTVEITRDGRSRDYTLDQEGALVSVEVFLTETPLAVQKEIQGQVGVGTIEEIDKAVEGGGISYEVDWTSKDGVEHSFSVLENGKLQSVEISLNEAPPAVKGAIAREIGTAPVQGITKNIEPDGVTYEVTTTLNGVSRDISVTEGGQLDSRQVFLPELPPAAQTTIQQSVGLGKVLRIDQVTEKVTEKKKRVTIIVIFEVEARKDGKPFDFRVDAKGTYLGLSQ